jgi:hypothetical protein
MSDRRLSQCRLVPAVLAACLFCLTALHPAPAMAEDQRTGLNESSIVDRSALVDHDLAVSPVPRERFWEGQVTPTKPPAVGNPR